VLAGTRAERPLEAIDLYKEGYAPIVILSPGIVEDAEVQLAKRGVRFPRQDELQRDALVQSGLPAAAVLSTGGYVDNTARKPICSAPSGRPAAFGG
jgi:hypothetical protein